jgi:glycerol-3-phosphate acyltransferase PlsX
MLKTSEAVAKLITDIIRQEIMGSFLTKIGGMLVKPAFKKLKTMLDPAEVGAGPLLGINGLVFVGHGRSNARAITSAIGVAHQAVTNDLLGSISRTIQDKLTSIPKS